MNEHTETRTEVTAEGPTAGGVRPAQMSTHDSPTTEAHAAIAATKIGTGVSHNVGVKADPPARAANRKLGAGARAVVALILAAAAFSVALASPASAARWIEPPTGPACGIYAGKVSVTPPRVWATYGTEQVQWDSVIQRWDSYNQRWYTYTTISSWASFNYYGQTNTSWSGYNYHNNRMNYPVSHAGYYRVASSINSYQGGVSWTGWVSNGAYCYVA